MGRFTSGKVQVMTTSFRSLLDGGFYSSNPFARHVPVSIRCYNPGAVNGAAWEKTYPGYVDTVETTPGNKTAIFEAPEYGVAVWWELLRRYAKNGADTVGEIITKYGGGQDYSNYVQFVRKQTGYTETQKIDLDDDQVLLTFGKAMFQYEAGRTTPLADGQILYGFALGRNNGSPSALPAPHVVSNNIARTPPAAPTPLEHPQTAVSSTSISLDTVAGVRTLQYALIQLGYLDPPADGGYGPVSKWALREFAHRHGLVFSNGDQISSEVAEALVTAEPLPLTPGSDLAGRIVVAMQKNGYWIARHPDCVNIVYIEGLDQNGQVNDNRNNVFNDLRIVFKVQASGVPKILGMWDGTTEPSRKYTLQPMNPGGAFHIKFGQCKAWVHGFYHIQEALIQAGEIEGYRDPHKTFHRDFSYPVRGANFGVHQHWGYDLPHDDMGNSSAGCLVGRSTAGHRDFMNLVMQDPRYQANKTYRFMTAIMPAGDL
jgi:Putative peptidoglycan binding domain